MKSQALALLAILTFSAGTVMAEPADQNTPEQTGRAEGLTSDQKQPELTPAERVARDFQTLNQDHATVGAATSRRDDQ